MQTILILGAGKSSTYLIDFLSDSCTKKERRLILADIDLETALSKLKNRTGTRAEELDSSDSEKRKSLISAADVVISMLPAFLHPVVAKDCLDLGKHFFTASYESEELRTIKPDIEAKGLLFLNECGLDPGIDHMSAMKIIHEASAKGEKILSFKSYCGGLLAPESEDNPWKYKFTWNPRNVVLAGQGASRYIEKGELKFVPYHRLFKRLETINFPGLGDFDGYPNRDSLSYRQVYELENIPTMLRGTLRRAGFCKAWDIFVQLGMTDDSFQMEMPVNSTLRQFLNAFLPYHAELNVEEKLAEAIPDLDFPDFEKIQWLGFFENRPLPETKGSPAQLLQAILEKDWQLNPEDRDMIVMQHLFEIQTKTGLKKVTSSLVSFGQDSVYTAMAKTVGLPLAIAVDLFLDGKIGLRGLHVPVLTEIYRPILAALEEQGIRFEEKVEPVNP
ncbi:saccharopine dehydrogenase C-terminal domain-containing protein [Algoriphagus boritolerans]|uniref:Saccharopine dehydrogenase (NADP+, L-glutamate forming) n=2 Tax=Algoriphagus TaxID=246875 RepID=A0A1H5Z835_9BACT|nr:saccharopine dehydrogenase C-terminal domain-containing protein [Algoriphagus boritolerans]SEG32511.1 saccharopine dehydrogenase (NADP+, L-glutamate forming) [Algoriphagus boritolerans DSM 17298 = JCM 18970]